MNRVWGLLSNGTFGYANKKPKNTRVWMYQHEGEKEQEIVKEGRYWYYNCPESVGGGEVGCDTLDGAKGDLRLYEGTRVWSKLIPNK